MFSKNRSKKAVPIRKKSDINVTPLIDVLLVLLVIFMVISPRVQTGLKTQVTYEAPPGAEQKREEAIVLSLHGDGTISINQEPLELPDDILPLPTVDTRSPQCSRGLQPAFNSFSV
ncbi:MAG TPA: biopolymer transporter ExbD [Terriglobia bacterium]|nr:biopolymer transporter ExbD [Terriglobia bacterium]